MENQNNILHKKAGIRSKLVLFTLLVLFLQIFFFKDILTYYYPAEDEFALLVHSIPMFNSFDPAGWFTIGFAKYFTVYPEWTPYYQNVMRPIVNVVYYINSLIFGNNYGFYLLFSYLLNGIAFSLVYYIARRILRLSENFSVISAALFLLNPGLLGKFYFYPSFAFDLFAAIVSGIVLLLMFKRKFYPALIISVFGMFLKETMMFLPLALTITYLILQRRDGKQVSKILVLSYLLLPYIVWIGVRISLSYVFEGASYTEHLSNPKFFAVTLIQSVMSWPLGIPDRVDVITNFKSFTSMNFAQVNAFYILASLFNLVMNAFFIIYAVMFAKKRLYKNMNTSVLVILSWLFIYYIMIIVLGLETRFGETLDLLGIPFVLYLAIRSFPKIYKYSSYTYVGFIVIYGFIGYFNLFGADTIDMYKMKYKNSRELIDLIKENSTATGDLLLVNDITAGFGSGSLESFAGVNRKIMKINSITFDDIASHSVSGFDLTSYTNGDTVFIFVTVPQGTEFQFEGIDSKEFAHNEKEWFARDPELFYKFPNEKVTGISQSTGTQTYDLGNKMNIKYLSSGADAVIYFNPSAGKYEIAHIFK